MFIGHYGVGFAAKRTAAKISLGTYFIAASLLDLLWSLFLVLGLERVQIDPGNTAVSPIRFVQCSYSHSLLTALLWSGGMAAVYGAIRRDKGGALVLSIVSFSHWLLDALAHQPELPLYPGSTVLVGLGLWNSVGGTLAFEGALFAAGVFSYSMGTRPIDRVGRYALWALAVLLAVIYILNIVGPPPPSEGAIGWVGLAAWLFVAWGCCIDRHRETMEMIAHRIPAAERTVYEGDGIDT